MSTESVVQVELIRKERRFWFSRLSGVSSCKLNAMCAKSGKFFYSNASADERVNWKTASSGTGDFSWRASSVILPIVRELSEEYDAHAIAAAALQMAYDKTRPAWMQSEGSSTEEERSACTAIAAFSNFCVEEQRKLKAEGRGKGGVALPPPYFPRQ